MAEKERKLRFGKQTIPVLAKYLKDRGIASSKVNKSELVELAVKAEQADLPVLSPNDYIQQNEKRRTVRGKILPDPRTVSSTKWSTDLRELPTIESHDVSFYLRTVCEWPEDSVKKYKNDNGYRLHSDGHINTVKMYKVDPQCIYVIAKCVPETRQSAEPYNLWILVEVSGVIHSGECGCVA
jgi:hypothetical protein